MIAERRPPTARTLAPPLWLVGALALAWYLRLGFGYGTGDHEELVPQLLRLLDPDLFPRDPYLLAEDDAFSVRFVWLRLLWAAALVVGTQGAFLVWTVVSWLGVAWAMFRLSAALVPSRPAALLAVLLGNATVGWTPGGNALVAHTLTPEPLAWIPALLAVEAFARERVWRAGALVGATMWLQALMGLQIGLLLGIVALWRVTDGEPARALRHAVGFGAIALAIGAPLLVPTLLTQAGTAPPADGLSTFFVTAVLRQAHHYLLSAQSQVVLARFGAVVAAGLAGLFVLRRRGEPPVEARFGARVLAVIGVLVALYVTGTEGAESLTVAKMQTFRLTLVAKLVLLTWVAGAVVALAPRLAARVDRGLDRRAVGWSATGLAVGLVVALAVAGVGRPAAMWRISEHRATDLYRAERWIDATVAPDALFLVPPGSTTFRTHARRSVAINFKPTTFRDDAMHRWLSTLRRVAPAPLPDPADGADGAFAWRRTLDPAYHAHTPAEWAALAEHFGADFALVDTTQTPTPPAGEPVHVEGRWAVYRLAP